jgi:hypothetical protein
MMGRGEILRFQWAERAIAEVHRTRAGGMIGRIAAST